MAESVYALYLLTMWTRITRLPAALPLPPAHLYADSRYWSAQGDDAPAPGGEPSDSSDGEAPAEGRAARRAARKAADKAVKEALRKRAKLEAARQELLREHVLPRRTLCQAGPDGRGCGALVWEGEKDACCRKGTNKLTEEHNPPMSEEYRAMLQQPSVSHNSRMLNTALAFGASGTSPGKDKGGQGLHTESGGLSFVKLQGKMYHTLRSLEALSTYLLSFLSPSSLNFPAEGGLCHCFVPSATVSPLVPHLEAFSDRQ
jgi:hypothetical protein